MSIVKSYRPVDDAKLVASKPSEGITVYTKMIKAPQATAISPFVPKTCANPSVASLVRA